MLEQIDLKGFKSIEAISVDLKRINILIGANGAGKSNFLSFFKMLNYLTSRSLQIYVAQEGGANSILYCGSKHTAQLEAQLFFNTQAGLNSYKLRLADAAPDKLVFTQEAVSYTRKASAKRADLININVGALETELDSDDLSDKIKQTCKVIHSIISRWRVYHFHDTTPESKIRKGGNVNDNRYLRDNAGNLAAFLYKLKLTNKAYYKRIVETIRLVAPFFDDFMLEPLALNRDMIMLEWKDRHAGEIFGPHQLSDGTLRMMAIITLFLQPDTPDMIVIDEPELGLHPYAISVLAALIKGVSGETQVVVSTQSTVLLEHFEPEDVIIVDRDQNKSVFNRKTSAELESWLEDYSLAELWEKNVIGGRPSL